ncbi:MAG TPA: 16S rRNA (cytosine(1402)-N(4))-methyltransferase RsmH [Acholeplasmataceae bacterium]|nr:16S rRNA (cytosine(1402)-N(4))-methyltransferase RsmH [Acholeplasmataceae bacterium]
MKHETVLLEEAIKYLNIKEDGIYVDGTLGGAGHSQLILNHLKSGHLYAFDQDLYAINVAKDKLKGYNNKTVIHDNFANIKKQLKDNNVSGIDGILLDLGMSSFQIDDETRGFTYLKDTNLDMRMDLTQETTAADIVNNYSKDELANIFFKYGDEENSFKIVNEIIRRRPLTKTFELVNICDRINYKRKGHSAKKVFQALRIEVNKELEVLETLLEDIIELLNPGGRIVIITFHSLEDRIVKHFYKEQSEYKVPKGIPLINIPKMPLKIITRKPIYPTEEEIKENSRAKSAKLRVAERTNA